MLGNCQKGGRIEAQIGTTTFKMTFSNKFMDWLFKLIFDFNL